MTNKFVNILNLCGDIILVVHVGKLETLLRIDCAELSDKNQAKIIITSILSHKPNPLFNKCPRQKSCRFKIAVWLRLLRDLNQ